jgi:hypothetical protein
LVLSFLAWFSEILTGFTLSVVGYVVFSVFSSKDSHLNEVNYYSKLWKRNQSNNISTKKYIGGTLKND